MPKATRTPKKKKGKKEKEEGPKKERNKTINQKISYF